MSATTSTDLPRLLGVRRGVRAALVLGIMASLSANVLHASPDIIARVISAWPPVALIVTVELITRIPVASQGLSTVRIAATAVVAGIAAWVSYWHMAAVVQRYGEDPVAAHMIPLSVDGLIVVASACLVEIGRHVRAAESSRPAPLPVSRAEAPVPGDALLPVALDVARKISPNGDGPPSASALARGLRDRGYRLGSSRVRPLADAVAARWPELAGVAR